MIIHETTWYFIVMKKKRFEQPNNYSYSNKIERRILKFNRLLNFAHCDYSFQAFEFSRPLVLFSWETL